MLRLTCRVDATKSCPGSQNGVVLSRHSLLIWFIPDCKTRWACPDCLDHKVSRRSLFPSSSVQVRQLRKVSITSSQHDELKNKQKGLSWGLGFCTPHFRILFSTCSVCRSQKKRVDFFSAPCFCSPVFVCGWKRGGGGGFSVRA